MSGILSDRPQHAYPCSQQELYTIVETGWGSYAQYLSRFVAHSTNYSASTGTDQLAALAAARLMPDEDSRAEVHKTLRLQMKGKADACMMKWSDMGTYIRDGFEADEYENKRVAAGYNYYEQAGHENWDAVKGLMQNGLLFLTGNETVLTNEGGMPATFIADFVAIKDAFEQKYQAFLQAEEQTKVMTDAKIIANNGLYDALMDMFEDGKKVSREDAAIREQFTFDRVWALVSGSGSGSGGVGVTVVELELYVYDRDTELPLDEAELKVLNAPDGMILIVKSNAEGFLKMSITGFEANETLLLQVELSAVGYELETGELEVTAGNVYSMDAGMVALVE